MFKKKKKSMHTGGLCIPPLMTYKEVGEQKYKN